jgi:hypothetical protein
MLNWTLNQRRHTTKNEFKNPVAPAANVLSHSSSFAGA